MTRPSSLFFLITLLLCLILITTTSVISDVISNNDESQTTTTTTTTTTPSSKKKRVAIVTLVTTSTYVPGAEVLVESLRHVNATGERVLLYVLPEDDDRSDLKVDEHIQDLHDAGWERTIQLTSKDGTYTACRVTEEQQQVIDANPIELAGLNRYWGTCSKFAIWTLTEYDVVVYMDADSIALNNFDFVFDLLDDFNVSGISLAAQGATNRDIPCWDDDPLTECNDFYSAFLVIKPFKHVHEFLHRVATTNVHLAEGELPLLNQVFGKWKLLPRYTLVAATEQARPHINISSDDSSSAFQVDWERVKVYDFAGLPSTKPWKVWEVQNQTGNKFLHTHLGEVEPNSKSFHTYMYPHWVWIDYYDTILERKKMKRITKESSSSTCDDQEDLLGECVDDSSSAMSIVVTPNSTGLLHDANVFEKYFGSKVVHYSQPADNNSLVWIFLELTPSYYMKQPSVPDNIHKDWMSNLGERVRVWVMVNPDQFYDEILLQNGLELVLCKTRQCVDWIQAARQRLNVDVQILYIGFTSIISQNIDKMIHHETQNFNRFLHIAGKSPHKGTVSIINAWIKNPHWPQLTLTSYDNLLLDHVLGKQMGQNLVSLPPNINFIDHKMTTQEILQFKVSHGVHLCTSSMEGFGHSLNEARAVGALIISTDYPAMNEFFDHSKNITDKDAILIKPNEILKWTNGLDYGVVDVAGIEQAMNKVLSMTIEERKAIGSRARQSFEENDSKFGALMKKLKCTTAISGGSSCLESFSLEVCAELCGLLLE